MALRHSNAALGRCSYNRINDVYACENNETLNTELKGYGGFAGWVMSGVCAYVCAYVCVCVCVCVMWGRDAEHCMAYMYADADWGGTHSTMLAANSGACRGSYARAGTMG